MPNAPAFTLSTGRGMAVIEVQPHVIAIRARAIVLPSKKEGDHAHED